MDASAVAVAQGDALVMMNNTLISTVMVVIAQVLSVLWGGGLHGWVICVSSRGSFLIPLAVYLLHFSGSEAFQASVPVFG